MSVKGPFSAKHQYIVALRKHLRSKHIKKMRKHFVCLQNLHTNGAKLKSSKKLEIVEIHQLLVMLDFIMY